MASTPSELLTLRTASMARRLIETGELDPHVALSYAIWPTRAMQEAVSSVETRGSDEAGAPSVQGPARPLNS